MTGEPALLEARDVSIAVDRTTVVADLSLTTRGRSVLLVGSCEVLLAAISGAPLQREATDGDRGCARVVSGSLRVLGNDVASGQHRECCSVAPLDPAMPPSWTIREYLAWGAHLSGANRRNARTVADAALERLKLGALAGRRLHTLAPPYRRAVAIALAIVNVPQALLIEAPFSGLDEAAAAFMLELIRRAAEGRATMVSAARITLGSAIGQLAATATDICLLRDGELVLQASPSSMLAGARCYEVTVAAGAQALREALAQRGVELHGGPLHFSVTLPEELGPSDVLAAAATAGASVVNCLPLIG